MENAIITGADGFIGRKLTVALTDRGYRVYALVHDQIGIYADNKLVVEIPFDISDVAAVQDQLPRQASFLFHLAWVGVSTTVKNNQDLQFRNIGYGMAILKLAHELAVRKIIFPGSVSEYAYCGQAVNGANVPCPSDFYSAAKVALHFAGDLYARQNGLTFIWVLISSIYGPGRDDNNLITYTIKSLLAGERPSFTRLEQLWDYIYIDDLIQAFLCVAQSGQGGRVYPIGSGEYHPLRDYVTIIRDRIDGGLELGIGEIPYKTQSIDNSIVDISALRADTGFQPRFSFEAGIALTIDYFRQKLNNQF